MQILLRLFFMTFMNVLVSHPTQSPEKPLYKGEAKGLVFR